MKKKNDSFTSHVFKYLILLRVMSCFIYTLKRYLIPEVIILCIFIFFLLPTIKTSENECMDYFEIAEIMKNLNRLKFIFSSKKLLNIKFVW